MENDLPVASHIEGDMKEEPVKPKVLNNTNNNITNMLANDTMPAHAYKNRKSSGAVMLEGKSTTINSVYHLSEIPT